MTLLDEIRDALDNTGALGQLAGTLGATPDQTTSLIGAGLPALLGGLGAQSSGDGAKALFGLIGNDKSGFVDHIGSFFAQGDRTGLASKLVGSLFGSQRGAIESHVGSSSGASLSMVSRLLPMLAPAVMALLGKLTSGSDASGLAERLGAIGADGPLGDLLASGTDDDRAGFLSGIADFAKAGGLGALLPGAAGAAAVAGGAAHALPDHADDDDRDRTGLGWLAPVLLALGALITGLVLWQCADSDGPREVVAATADEPEDEAHGDPADEEEVVEEEEEEAAPAAEPTTAPEPTAAPEPAFTIADLAAGNPDLSGLVDLVTRLGLAEAISDPNGGPFTIFAPTNDALGSASAILDRLDEGQTRTTVTYHVVPGTITAADLVPGATFDTLAGETLTVGDDGTLNGGIRVTTADLAADNGVVHLIEGVLVPGSIQRVLATEDVNELFVLEPIQFALGSAQILPESIPTLDQAVATLSNLPAGSKFEVQGHTDSQGDDASNQLLSEARAASVVEYLTANGVAPDVLEARGYGETQLKVSPEQTEADFAANRRIEFVDIS